MHTSVWIVFANYWVTNSNYLPLKKERFEVWFAMQYGRVIGCSNKGTMLSTNASFVVVVVTRFTIGHGYVKGPKPFANLLRAEG